MMATPKSSREDVGRRPRGLFVLGMHRSGTSAAARLINLMGIPLGASLDISSAPAADNPTGHWESRGLRILNDEVLAHFGASWSAPPSLVSGWEKDPALRDLAARASESFARLFRSSTWAWKDPRNCLTLPFWLEVTKAEPVVVWILRHPLEIAESLRTRDDLGLLYSLALWQRYTRAGLASTAGLPAYVTTYDALLEDPLRWCEQLSGFLAGHGFSDAGVPEPLEVERFVDPSLRHATPPALEPGMSELLGLDEKLQRLIGAHDAFRPPGADDEPAWVSSLFDARRAAEMDRARAIELGAQIERLTRDAELELQRETGRLNDRIEELSESVTRLEGHSARQAEGIDWLREEVAVRERELEATKSSRSWRMARRLQGLDPRPRAVSVARRVLPVRLKRRVKRIWDPGRPSTRRRLRTGRSTAKRQTEATDLLPLATNYDIVCLSIIDWEFRWQRPQQLMSRFARMGHRVFYVSATRFAPERGSFETAELTEGVWEVRLGCQHFDPYSGRMHARTVDDIVASLARARKALRIEEAVCVVQVPTWFAPAGAAREHFGWPILYDCMDDWTDFPGMGKAIDEAEEDLVADCDVLLVSGRELMDAWSATRPDALLVANALDRDRFGEGEPSELLQEIPKPIVGYVGAIAEWFDVEVVEEVARERPDYSLVLVGGVFDVSVQRLERLPNVHMLGQRPYEEMPGFIRAFDVCLIPFVMSEVTHAVDPVKLYEYLSQGKPVVGTRTRELRRYEDLIYLAEGADEFVCQVDAALAEADTGLAHRRIAFAHANTWEDRAAAIKEGVRRACAKISVIAVSYNNIDDTRRCLESVLNGSLYPNLEVIVVDNASTDGTPEYVRSLVGGDVEVRLIANEENRGFAAANNQGLAVASGERVVLLNNDTVVPNGWLRRLLRHLDRTDVGLVVAVTNFSGNESRIDVSYESVEEMDEFARRLARDRAGEHFDIRVAAMYCVAMRRDVLELVGPLDERFGLGLFEDDDYSERVRTAGYRVICAEDAFVHHVGQASFGKLSSREYQRIWDTNQHLYEEKWGRPWQPYEPRKTPVGPSVADRVEAARVVAPARVPAEMSADRVRHRSATRRLPEELRARLGSQEWLRHNLRLDDETVTMPGTPEFLEADRRFDAVIQILKTIVGSSLRDVRVADLGSLEGGFALGLALEGAEVTGFEARELNMEKLRLVEEHFALPNLRFVQEDVKDFSVERDGTWDCVLALGILYHLDRPVEWLKQVAETTRILIVDSHFAPPDGSMSRLDERLTLGPMETIEADGRAYEGRWFHEYGPEHDPELQALASYSNRSSFWLSRTSLFRAVLEAGFPFVWEYQDQRALDDWELFSISYPRTILVAVKQVGSGVAKNGGLDPTSRTGG